MKIRIFALAKELGFDSKDLIQHCNDAGLDVKSSPLASITPAERDLLMDHLQKLSGKAKASESASVPAAIELSRDEPVRELRPREIRDLGGPLSTQMRTRRPPRKESAQSLDETVSPADSTSDLSDQEVVAADSLVVPTHDSVEDTVASTPVESEAAASSTSVPPAPVRPAPVPTRSMRDLSQSGQRSPSEGKKSGESAPSTIQPAVKPAITPVAKSVAPVIKPVEVLKPAQVVSASAEASVEEEAPKPNQPIVNPPAVVAEVPQQPIQSEKSVASPASPVISTLTAESVPPVEQRPAPITRAEYVATSRSASPIREMRPHGSVRVSEERPARVQEEAAPAPIRRDNKKRGPALPALATPNFKPAVAKKVEEPIHKPDLALTGDVLKKNKLADILKKNRDDSVRRTPTTEEEDKATPAKGRGGVPARGLGLEEAREARRRRRTKTKGGADEDDRVIHRSVKRQRRNSGAVERKANAVVSTPITVRSLSEDLGRPARDLLTILFSQGKMVTINDLLDEDVALELGMELGVVLEIAREQDFEEVLADRLNLDSQGSDVELVSRPPIITVLGHVDHGKTTLVDRIRSANVAAGEAGGITQHIAAYQVEKDGQKMTFVDTPGHAAFGEMRARGANVTDIIILVVAADDGVMPQTVECISHAKAAGVPIIVAMNKCDLPTINEQRVLTELSQHGILPSEWGGDVEVVRVSGLTGLGVDSLLETILVTAELQDYRSPVNVPADGVCLEAFRDEGRGPLAWGIVRLGTLRVGDLVLCGPSYGRVRAMYTDRGEEIQEAGPSTPVKIAGLNEVPGAGDHIFVMQDIEQAREFAEERRLRGRTAALSGRGGPVSLEEFFASSKGGGIKDLPLIIKADAPGSLEAIRHELEKFEHPEVRIKILHTGVGGVNESDVYLAASTGAIIVAFHVIAEDRAESLAAQERVEIRRYRIIYNVTEDIRQALEGLLEPEKVEVATGRALVLQTFGISRVGTVAGCRILNGTIDRNNRVHVIRDQTVLNHYGIASLKRGKDDAKEVREGFECGIRLDGFNDVKEGDLLEAYRIEERKRKLDE
ncbi:translation initiation factor IF-2 [Planctomicrobium sp. SH668]|uniref:translation initiation factor IF-2 n=1 Tax=Planctomicrobium sp. SH668 TaxID=3448126 RepID=UPI003F5B3040